MGSVVAFAAEPSAGEAQILNREQSVTELVDDLLDPTLPWRIEAADQQLDPAPAVEVPDNLLVLHQRAPLNRPHSEAVPREITDSWRSASLWVGFSADRL
ncbi:hypothetical protein [Streptomyces sp. NEAU-NA10]|uniref:hypothetical protein n=1 Tax=Streptomyces sp. NEAU-NA10 TaxID=3416050 RepID=UPI003CC5A7B1